MTSHGDLEKQNTRLKNIEINAEIFICPHLLYYLPFLYFHQFQLNHTEVCRLCFMAAMHSVNSNKKDSHVY